MGASSSPVPAFLGTKTTGRWGPCNSSSLSRSSSQITRRSAKFPAITARGLLGRFLRWRKRATASADAALTARWKPPRPRRATTLSAARAVAVADRAVATAVAANSFFFSSSSTTATIVVAAAGGGGEVTVFLPVTPVFSQSAVAELIVSCQDRDGPQAGQALGWA